MPHSGCSALHGVNPNLKKKTHAFKIMLHVLKVATSYKHFLDKATSYFISFCFTSALTLADIIFHKILEIYLTL